MSLPLPKIAEALKEAKKKAKPRKFKQSVELIIKLRDVDLKNPANRLNTVVFLPHAPKKKVKIAVFAAGDMALKAKEAGADLVLGRDDIERLAGNKKEIKKLAKEYDFFLAQADLMPLIGRYLGRFLGPRGKMPAPVPPRANIEEIIKRYRSAVRLRVRDQLQVACRIGTEDQSEEELAENAQAIINQILQKYKPYNLDKVYVKLTMGKPVSVKVK